MGFRNNCYCSVFQVEPKSDRLTSARISISKKNRNTNEYEVSFSGYVAFAGTECAAKAAQLKPEDGHPVRIKLLEVDVCNTYDKEKKVTYWNPYVYSFEDADAQPQISPADMMAVTEQGIEGDEDSLPW